MFNFFNKKQQPQPIIDPIIDNTTCAVNFDNMNIFSIERIIIDNKSVTSIGYFDKQNNVNEWLLRISPIQHMNLCKSFQQFLDKNDISGTTIFD